MADEKVVIDVQAKFTDKMNGVKKAAQEVDNLEKKAKKVSSKKHTVRFGVKDNASKGINKLLSKANTFGRKHFKGTFSLIDKASPHIKKITSAASSFTKRAYRGTLNFIDKATPIISKVTSSLRSFTGKVWRGTLSVIDRATAPLRKIKNALFSIQTLITSVAAAMATKLVIKSPIDYADTVENAQIAFESLLGSVEKADKMMSDVMQFAEDTPFDTQGVVDGVKQMLVYGIESKKVLNYMEKIGNTTAALGTGEQGIDAVTRALGQMKSKNKVSAQEMLQLTEAGVKAWDYLAKGAGVSTSKVQEMTEDGLIPADKAIQYIIDGMSEFDGLMDKASNRTVKGLASNIKDALQQSIVLKWGRGLQQGAVEGLKSMKTWLDRIDPMLEKAGTSLEEMGKTASSKVFGVIGGMQERAETSMNSKKFQEADLGGKIKILWDDVIWTPFSEWWESKGKPKLAEKMAEFGESLGKGISNGILALLGIDVSGGIDEGASIGASFAEGFKSGFDGEAVGDALIEAIKKGFKKGAKGLADLLLPGDQGASASDKLAGVALGYGGIKAIGGAVKLGKGLSSTKKFLFGGSAAGETGGVLTGLGGKLKSAGETAYIKGLYAKDGIKGVVSKIGGTKLATAATGKLASVGASLGSGATTAGGAAVAGAGSILGGIFGGAGLISAGVDLVKGIKEKNKKKKKDNFFSSGTKAGMVGAGAAAGAAIGSIIPVVGTGVGALVGAGVGGVGALLGGKKAGKALSDSTEEGGALNKAGKWIKKKGGQAKDWASEKWADTKEWGAGIKEKMSTFFKETLPTKMGELWDSVGEFFTETIPSAVSSVGEKISTFFTETIPTKWDEFWQGVDEFFTEKIPYALGFVAGKMETFFTETLPEKWNELWDGISTFFTETVPTALENFGEKVTTFFTETLPEKWGEFWDGVGNFFTETIPTALEPIWEKITTFFTETLPSKWTEFWDSVGNFFTETVPTALETVGEKITTFFTETIPTKWNEFWDGVNTFFTETIPTALETVGAKVTTFFTETLPGKWTEFWNGVDTFFTESIPTALSNIGSGITTFFTETIPGYFSGLWDSVSTWISEKIETAKASFGAGKESGKGKGKGAAKKANGGLVGHKTLTWLAEEGTPEMVIPLGGHRRARGISLWKRTGEMLGITPENNYNGGIVGGNASETPSASAVANRPASGSAPSAQNINVNVGGITIQISANGGASDILQTIKEQKGEIADVISDALFEALKAQFQNTPLARQGA